MKIAISVPDEVFQAGEHLAQQMKLSRSQLYTDALLVYLNEKRAAAVTAKLNAICDKESSKIGSEYLRGQSKILIDEA
jgi:metal-responsive CopG/Arc/MetJ family transcriptional regulator